MDKKDREKLYKRAWDVWGTNAQILVAVEECAELQHALTKFIRKGDKALLSDISNIAEEVADVEIMLEQIKVVIAPAIGDGVERQKEEKLRRLQQRLEERWQ